MKFTVEQIAKKVNGNIEGNSKVELFTLSKIEEAKQGSITFLSNPKYNLLLWQNGQRLQLNGVL